MHNVLLHGWQLESDERTLLATAFPTRILQPLDGLVMASSGLPMPHADFGDPDCCGCLNGIITATDCAEI